MNSPFPALLLQPLQFSVAQFLKGKTTSHLSLLLFTFSIYCRNQFITLQFVIIEQLGPPYQSDIQTLDTPKILLKPGGQMS